jgi:hypothetical protein
MTQHTFKMKLCYRLSVIVAFGSTPTFAQIGGVTTPYQSGICWDMHTGNFDLYMGGCHEGSNQDFYYGTSS